MGRARELTMGSTRRNRSTVGKTGDYALIRRLAAAPNPDPNELRAALDRVAAQAGRFRFIEGATYTAGCERYRKLTGEAYGPQRGTY